MLCDKYKEALIDAAAVGAALPTSLRGHFDVCAHCSETLTAQNRLFAAMEEGLRSRANFTVPVNFDHRIRAALPVQASPQRRPALSTFLVASMPAAAAVLIAILFTQSLRHGGKQTAGNSVVEPNLVASPLAPVLSGNAGSLEPSPTRKVYSGGGNALKTSHVLKAVAGRSAEAEVLVPEGQEELLAKYLQGIAARKVRVTFSAGLAPETDPKPVGVPSIEISELVVKPLPDLSSN
jgi:hypothetical protein